MTALTAKTTVKYTNMNKKGLWKRFKNYLTENQETITAGLAMISGTSYYAYSRMRNK